MINPALDLKGLTTSEIEFVQHLAGLPYQDGDILYYDNGNLQRLPIGAGGDVLTVDDGLPAWLPGGSGTIGGTIAEGEVAFGTGADEIGGSSNLFWDSSTNRLGINNGTPTHALTVNGDSIFTNTLNVSAGGASILRSSGSTTLTVTQSATGNIVDFYDGATLVMTIIDGGNVGIGTASPSSFKLQVGGSIGPNSNDGGALGSTSLSFSDLFLASGAVINFANSNYTLAHSSSLLTSSGSIRVANAYTLPSTDGSSGYTLVTDGSGNVSWSSVSSGVTFGSTKQIPYMNSTDDDFDYSTNLVFDSSSNALEVGSGSVVPGAVVIKGDGSTAPGTLLLESSSGDQTMLTSTATTGRSIELPDADGTIALTSDIPAVGANTALSNLASVAINTSLVPDADNTDDLGSATNGWKDVYLRTGKFDGSTSGTTTLQATAIAGTTTLTLPAATDTLVGKATTDTLTNKTISVDDNTISGIAASSFVLSNGSGNIDGSAAQKAIPSGAVVGTSDAQTLSNKKITRRVSTTNAPGATPSTNVDNVDVQIFTGLATDITSMTTNLSGTPTDCQLLELQFVDNGTPRSITWGSSFADGGMVELPTTTEANVVLRVLLEYQTTASLNKWVCVAVG